MYDSQKYIEMALKNGYIRDVGVNNEFIYRSVVNNKYSLRIYTTFICLVYDLSDIECEGLCTSLSSDGTGTFYRYMGIPADILMDIATGPVEDIRKKLYEYDINRTLEKL